MVNRANLSDEEWRTTYSFLLLNPCVHTGSEEKCKRFLNAVLWVLRSGTQWLLLPVSLGKWSSVFNRFSRWCERASLHKGCSQHLDLQPMLINSTITRAHACAAGDVGSGAEAEALGRSTGGFTTKIQAISDALGSPLDFILTEGQASDIGQAEALLQLTPAGAVELLGYKGYDSDAFIQGREMEAVIPPRNNRLALRDCDWFVYKERHLIECFFGKFKHYRRVFSRFEKRAKNYMGFIRFVAALIGLR